MRKILIVLVLAGVLLLVLSVPAVAGASDPPNAFGQLHKTANWGTDPVSGSPVPPGHRDLTNSPYPGNPGEHISMVVHQVKAGDLQFLGIYNWGDFIAFGKATL